MLHLRFAALSEAFAIGMTTPSGAAAAPFD